MHQRSGESTEDTGISDEDYVGYKTPLATLKKIIQVVISSDFKVWPDGGGLLDQDEQLFNDMANMLTLYHRRRPAKDDDENADKPAGPPAYTDYL